MRFDSRVASATHRSGAWDVTTQDGYAVRARFLVAATGVLSVPYIPDIPGRSAFRGVQHHTGRWPAESVDFRGKRVAVVGTSSSGVQVVPAIVDEVESLTVYQRSANWCTPLNNRPITRDEQVELRAEFEQLRTVLATSIHGFHHPVNPRSAFDDSPSQRQAFFETMWSSPGFMKFTSNYVDLLTNLDANQEWCEFIASKIRGIVQDPSVAEKLIPRDHRYGEKRPPYVAGYFEAFNRANVSLVDLRDTPIVRVTEVGIETTDGLRELDVIVWATGFDFGTGAMLRMGIRGRDGVALSEHWAEGPTTFLGLQTHGFPNLFFPGGPHAAAGNNPRYNGDQVDFVTDVLVQARDRGCDVIEVTRDAEDRWTKLMDKAASRTPFGTIGQYVGGNIPGKPRRYLLNAAGRPKLFETIAAVIEHDYAEFGLTRAGSGAPSGPRRTAAS
jgi:cation diffusion facilitator CzcD-associated flavoprotein CzcO